MRAVGRHRAGKATSRLPQSMIATACHFGSLAALQHSDDFGHPALLDTATGYIVVGIPQGLPQSAPPMATLCAVEHSAATPGFGATRVFMSVIGQRRGSSID